MSKMFQWKDILHSNVCLFDLKGWWWLAQIQPCQWLVGGYPIIIS